MKSKPFRCAVIKPISINEAWQGRRFMTSKYKKWREDMFILLPKCKKIGGEVKVNLEFWTKSANRSDLDNWIKPTLDAIVEKGYIDDDRKIMELKAKKFKIQKGDDYILIEIRK